MKSPLLSVIIPARNEFPNIAHTFHSIMNCVEADGIDPKEVEVIIVNNCSEDFNDPKYDRTKPSIRGTTSHLMGRGGYYNHVVRVVYDSLAGNHSARNTGAKAARGKYLYFSDGHVSLRPGFFKSILKTVETYGGLVFGSLQHMGAYPPTDHSMGFQYTWKLGDECRQTWANYKLAPTPWYIIGQGAWGMACTREEFFKLDGYEFYHKTYGGEFYLTTKAWMLGSTVMVDPNAIGYHLSSSRGYEYDHMDYVENILNLLYALGADDWRERTYINYLRTKSKVELDRIYAKGVEIYAKDREWIKEHAIYTFNQLLIHRPWDKKNIELHGKSNCHILVFHPTWLNLLQKAQDFVKDAYRNSMYQKSLEEFIVNNLWENVYHNGEFDKANLPVV